jgi:transposase
MPRGSSDKRRALQQEGTLHPARTRVRARLFWEHPIFFDARDELQVKYEMLRAHFVDEQAVTDVCAAFGYSRQTFYILRRRFARRGIAGLRDGRPGRVGPVKCTPDVVEFLQAQRAADPALSVPELQERLARERDVRLHRRTVERVVGRRPRKKTLPPADVSASPPRALDAERFIASGDAVQGRYEAQRTAFLSWASLGDPTSDPPPALGAHGLAGLLAPSVYGWTVRCVAAPRRPWSGTTDSRTTVLLEAYRFLLGPAAASGMPTGAMHPNEEDDHASSPCTRGYRRNARNGRGRSPRSWTPYAASRRNTATR